MKKQFIQNQIKDYVINNLWDKIIKLTKNNGELIQQNKTLKLTLISCIKQIFIIKQNYNISIPLIKIFNKENEKMKNDILNKVLEYSQGKIDNYFLTKNLKNNIHSKVGNKILSEKKLNNKSQKIIVNINNNSKEKIIYSDKKHLVKENLSNNKLYINSTSNNPTNTTINLNFNKISINMNNESEIKRKENKNINKNKNFFQIKTYQSKFHLENNNFKKNSFDCTSNYSDENCLFIHRDKSNLRNNTKIIIYKKIQKHKSNNKSMPKLPLEQILGKNHFFENI